PGQSPSTLAPPPPDASPTITTETPQKTTSPDAKKPMPRKSTYYKPMVIPNTNAESNTQTEVSDENNSEEESEEVIAARKQLEEAQRKLELAKQKATKKEVIEVAENKAEAVKVSKIDEEVIEVEEVEQVVEETEETEKNDDAKAKYDAIQAKLKKVQTSDDEVVEYVSVVEEVAETETKEPIEGVDYHIIVKGDNLYNLSKKYNTTEDKLTKLNDVKFNNLKIGQKLKLK
ncbi:MAG: LysM peptidoglycan-binding domain-containing protein, partial [Olleya sp.]